MHACLFFILFAIILNLTFSHFSHTASPMTAISDTGSLPIFILYTVWGAYQKDSVVSAPLMEVCMYSTLLVNFLEQFSVFSSYLSFPSSLFIYLSLSPSSSISICVSVSHAHTNTPSFTPSFSISKSFLLILSHTLTLYPSLSFALRHFHAQQGCGRSAFQRRCCLGNPDRKRGTANHF